MVGLFKARHNAPKDGDFVKSDADVANREVGSDTEGRDMDDADMARMGKRQQTRVSRCAGRAAGIARA